MISNYLFKTYPMNVSRGFLFVFFKSIMPDGFANLSNSDSFFRSSLRPQFDYRNAINSIKSDFGYPRAWSPGVKTLKSLST